LGKEECRNRLKKWNLIKIKMLLNISYEKLNKCRLKYKSYGSLDVSRCTRDISKRTPSIYVRTVLTAAANTGKHG